MTGIAEYTGDEWALLTGAPEVVGFGMLAASRSGLIGKLREFFALRACLQLRRVPADLRQYQMIRAVLAMRHTAAHEPGAVLAIRANPIELLATFIAPRSYMLSYSERIATLLERTAPRDEADGFKRWLMWIAQRVVGASGDGWLGTGTRISDDDNDMLNHLAESLHMVTAADETNTVEAEMGPHPSADFSRTVVDTSTGS